MKATTDGTCVMRIGADGQTTFYNKDGSVKWRTDESGNFGIGENKMKHKHYEYIIAWANGASIQVLYQDSQDWYDEAKPSWNEGHQYRIKPEEKKPVVRWLWADACGNSSCCLLSEDEAKQIADHTIKLEWSRTEFPE